jgi:hypothetical protein
LVVKRKIPRSLWESNPRTLIIQPIAQCYVLNNNASHGPLSCDTIWWCNRETNVLEDQTASIFIVKDGGSLVVGILPPTTSLHSITTQKTTTWIFTAVKTSNLAIIIQVNIYFSHCLKWYEEKIRELLNSFFSNIVRKGKLNTLLTTPFCTIFIIKLQNWN